MHKTILSVIGIAVAIVILVIAYRIFDGAGGTAKVGDIEVTVESRTSTEPTPKPKSSEILPTVFMLRKLTCIRPQEPKGEDRVYLKLGGTPTQNWSLKSGESVQLDLAAEAGSTISLWEQDGIMKDSDDDFLGTVKLQSRAGTLRFETPGTGNHLYLLQYDSDT